MVRLALAACALALHAQAAFELAAPGRAARIYAPAGPVRLAALNLARDVERITGRAPVVVDREDQCGAPCVSVRISPDLAGKWEVYRIRTSAHGLDIDASDQRGAIFGIYAFAERYLGVDPMSFWTGREPVKRARLAWDRIELDSAEPTFRFRGWFLNDEDLLTEWRDGGGKRHLDYPYYHQVTHPDVLERVFESMLRLGYNLVIPASFTDIDNPDEARMVQAASRRGLYVSMHHVEPMGVSGFAFQRYWRLRGKTTPFSFVRHQDAFDEVWRYYAARWAQYPDVVWQLGLRGIADRPVWVSDPSVPADEASRGKLISDAIARQWEIIRSVDRRPQPLATTTLWMEGAQLHRKGFLRFPKELAVIFADNGPGWSWEPDFTEVQREPGRHYGVYEHHAFWSAGPHLVQAISPRKAHQLIGQAVTRGDTWYAILNVSNVREFALGVDASSRMLRDFPSFDPDRYLAAWCEQRFGNAAHQAEAAYRAFFDSYLDDPERGRPLLLDGQTLAAGKRAWAQMLSGRPPAAGKLLEQAREERRRMEAAGREIETIRAALTADQRSFFDTNFVAQQRLMTGLLAWLEAGLERDPKRGMAAVRQIREAQSLASQGRWKNWYRGDRKMNLDEAEALTRACYKEPENATRAN